MNDTEVLMLGLDAACFDRLNPLLEEGCLPNLERLCNVGVTSSLETTAIPWTPSAWPSVVTGSRPWTHGVYDFYDYEGTDPAQVSARSVQVPFCWEILSAFGYRSIVVNVPVTHPPHAFDGSLVPGYIAPESPDCLVDGECQSVNTLDDSYRLYPRSDARQSKTDEYCDLATSRAEMATRLAERHPWSFMMVQFQSTDAVFHALGNDDAAIRSVFEAVDDAIGSLLELVGEDALVFVVSDHGMHRYENVFHCNTWLRDQEYLQTATDSPRWGWNQRVRDSLVEDDRGTEASNGPVAAVSGMAVSGLRRIGLTPTRIERVLSAVGLDDAIAGRLPESMLLDIVDAGEHVDWANSEAYCRSVASLGIRCNVVGRDANGVIPRESFDQVRESLVNELRAVTGPSDEPIFDRVYDRHKAHGSDVANECSAPDIMLRPREMVWKVSDVIRDRTITDTTEFNHSFNGMFVASGNRINTDVSISPNVIDVVPTILSLFDIPPLKTMDGRVLSDLVSASVPDQRPPLIGDREFVSGQPSDPVSDSVQDQLREMGYIE